MPREPKRPRTIRGTSKNIENAARELRRESTSAERHLWEALRKRRLNGLRFRRQHPVGRFILDFYCPAKHLVIELDGASHRDRGVQDEERTAILNAHGYRVVRFGNAEVIHDLDSVLLRIAAAASHE